MKQNLIGICLVLASTGLISGCVILYMVFGGAVLLGIVIVFILVSYLVSSWLPNEYIITRTLVSLPFVGTCLLAEGLLTNIFKLNDEHLKTLLLNSGGSPRINLKLSGLPFTRYIAYLLFLAFSLATDLYYGNILNTSQYVIINTFMKVKYTYGLILLLILLTIVIVKNSSLGFKLKNICKLFFTMSAFKFFIEGFKLPGVLQKSFFSDISSSNWFSIIESDSYSYLVMNNKEESKYLLLPIHRFFFSFGRLLQVLLHILLWILGLFLIFLLLIAITIAIYNYIVSPFFGHSGYSFYDVMKNYVSWRKIDGEFSLEKISNKLIIRTGYLGLFLEWIFNNIFNYSNLSGLLKWLSKIFTNIK